MNDREKVIKGLEICYNPPNLCADCPYDEIDYCNDALCRDALDLLKEQEPVKPKKHMNIVDCCSPSFVYGCGNCNGAIRPGYSFCPFCGRKLNWDV